MLDEPGSGGACHHYFIGGFHTKGNPAADSSCNDDTAVHLLFQNGPIAEVGVNGITHEALLAILIDRLEHFQNGPFANPHNRDALTHLQMAQKALHDRTRERMERGVEGTHTV